MALFDMVREEHTAPAGYAESSFQFLNRSTRPEIQRIRDVCEDWHSRYPETDKAELRTRFRDRNNNNHNSAFFELFLHELLLRSGYKVICHPETANETTTHPDFCVTSPTGIEFYLEAVVVTGKTEVEKSTQMRMNQAYDTLNHMNSPNIFLHIRIHGEPATPPSGRKMREELERYLANLDPDQIYDLRENYDYEEAEHVYRYDRDGWVIDFYPIPKSLELRGKPGIRPLGRHTDQLKIMKLDDALRSALLSKARHYGKLELPLIVAVNALHLAFDDSDYQQALRGTEQIFHNEAGDTETDCASNGVFYDEYGPRLSPILFFKYLKPDNFPRTEALLVHNRLATTPLHSILSRLTQVGHGQREHGETLAEIFEISSDWPKEESE